MKKPKKSPKARQPSARKPAAQKSTSKYPESKIIDVDSLAKIIADLKAAGKKVSHCHGCFDLMHPGHIMHFQAAKKMADALVVTLSPDRYVDKGPGRPVYNQDLRAKTIASLECVDYVAINKWPTAEDTLRLLKPSYYVKGQEFQHLQDKTGKIQREAEIAKEVGAELKFTQEIVFSSTKLINEHLRPADAPPQPGQVPQRFVEVYPEPTRQFLSQFAKKYSFNQISEKINQISRLKVLLVGDGIIDEYHYCRTMGKSAKSPIIAYRYNNHEVFAGGAFAIANHMSGICSKVELVTLLGRQDSREDFIRANLRDNIKPTFFFREDGPTVIKKRYVEQYLNQKAFEVNYLNNSYIDEKLEDDIIKYIFNIVADYDMVLVSDFGHGLITSKMIRVAEKRAGTFKMCVNSQTNGANSGFNLITKYRKPSFVCLDEPEARLATQDRFGPPDQLARNLAKIIQAGRLIITLGKSGSIGLDEQGRIETCPVFSTKVVDTVGAGDAFFSFSALCYTAGMPLDLMSFVGNVVGALKVQTMCNKKPVEKHELLELIHDLLT